MRATITQHAIGIKTVILMRRGHLRWMTYPSPVLQEAQAECVPPTGLVRMFSWHWPTHMGGRSIFEIGEKG